MEQRFTGKTVIVTGASSGIGEGYARRTGTNEWQKPRKMPSLAEKTITDPSTQTSKMHYLSQVIWLWVSR
jgi:short-subunit dehydrogenase involved in D-alanine esterification of teichoic acids